MNLERVFSLKAHQTTIKQEVSAGTIAFLTSVYIVAINSTILADAGVPIAGAALATIITCFLGCLLMGFWSNAPILLIPGMGINAMFTYTFVQGSGLMWQEALAVVFTAGVLFMVIAFTPIAASLTKAIPDTLKAGITAGIGLFLTFIGLQKGGLIESNSDTFVQLANLTEHAFSNLINITCSSRFICKANTRSFFMDNFNWFYNRSCVKCNNCS